MYILIVLAIIAWPIIFGVLYVWTAGSSDDPKFVKPALFTSWILLFDYFLTGVLVVAALSAISLIISFMLGGFALPL